MAPMDVHYLSFLINSPDVSTKISYKSMSGKTVSFYYGTIGLGYWLVLIYPMDKY